MDQIKEKNFIIQYFHDSFHELGKVVWPTRNRAINICVLVVAFVLISAALVAAVDFLFNRGMGFVVSLKN